MKFLLLIVVGMSSAYANPNLKGLSMEDAYQMALKRSEDLQIQEEQVIQAEEKLTQAKGYLWPTINGVGTFLRQDTSATTSLTPSTQNTARININQPLFRGLRDFAALRQQKKNVLSTEFLRDQARSQLYADVSQAYYQLMILFHDVNIYKHQIEVNEKRLKELRSYRRIGRSRESDVLALEASIAALEATIDSAKTQMENAWSVFEFLTDAKDRPTLSDQETISVDLGDLSKYLSKVNDRPDLKALEASMNANEEGVAIARGGHFPTLDLLGNYYLERPGVLSPVKWDVALALTVPIFQGGVVQSQVREATSAHQVAELKYQKAKRLALEQIETLYNQVKLELAQQQKQDRASELAQKNYEAQLRDGRLGLSTNIDVLTALSNVQDSLRLSNRIYYQTRMDYLKLLAATAERPKR